MSRNGWNPHDVVPTAIEYVTFQKIAFDIFLM